MSKTLKDSYYFRKVGEYFLIGILTKDESFKNKYKFFIINTNINDRRTLKEETLGNSEILDLLAVSQYNFDAKVWKPIEAKTLSPNEKLDIETLLKGESTVTIFDLLGDDELIN